VQEAAMDFEHLISGVDEIEKPALLADFCDGHVLEKTSVGPL
jgi:hypothetical protein